MELTKAREFYISYRKVDGSPLEPEQIEWYTNKASIFEGLKRGLEAKTEAHELVGE